MPRRSTKPKLPKLTMDRLAHIGEFDVVERDGILILRGPLCKAKGQRPQAVLISGRRRALQMLCDLRPPPSYAPEIRRILQETIG